MFIFLPPFVQGHLGLALFLDQSSFSPSRFWVPVLLLDPVGQGMEKLYCCYQPCVTVLSCDLFKSHYSFVNSLFVN